MRKNINLVFPELSYAIVGSAFDVFNALGYGYSEKYYQRALGLEFKRRHLSFKEQVYSPLEYKGKTIGKNFFDFLVENSVIVEIKKDGRFSKSRIDQVVRYLKISKLKLAILVNFSTNGVLFKRIVNIR